MRFPATFPPNTVQVNGREIPYARFPKAGQWTYDAYTLAPVVYTDAAPCDRPLEVVLTFDDHAAWRAPLILTADDVDDALAILRSVLEKCV